MRRHRPTDAPGVSIPAVQNPPVGARRGDVQGLRAIAVLAVVAGHYGVPFLRGGYVGVDVFFVISGFLISGLLFREVESAGRISLRDFYARRARRILPAATLVTVLTLVGALLWIGATDALRTVTDAVWATLFAANVHFAQVGTDYNQQDFATSPLQHYWSLAVEEQFYVVWPLLLLGCLLVARRLRRAGRSRSPMPPRHLPRRGIAAALVALTAASFAYAVVASHTDPEATYFSTGARVWELAVGGLAAMASAWCARRLPRWGRATLTVVGVAAIAVACVTFGATSQSYAVSYLLPVLGSAAVLLGGVADDGTTLPARALGIAPLRLLGDWSYSFYLWHWPLLILALGNHGPISSLERWLLAGLALGLAALTHQYVETPFLSPIRVPRPRALALYPASLLLVAASCASGTVYAHYRAGEFGHNPAISLTDFGVSDPADYTFPQDPVLAMVKASVLAGRNHMAIPSHLQPKVTDLSTDVPDLGDCEYGISGNRNLCPRGDTSSSKVMVVLGNSHGRMWIPALEQLAEREHYRTYYFTKRNCTAADLVVSDVSTATPLAPWQDCTDFRQWAFQQIAALHPALTIVSSTGPNPTIYTPDGRQVDAGDPDRGIETQHGFGRTFRDLLPFTDRLVLLRDIPKPGFDAGDCLTTGGHDLGSCLFTPEPTNQTEADESVAAARERGVQVVDTTPWFCWDGSCPLVVGDDVVFRDTGHITSAYALALTEELGRALGIWTDDDAAGSASGS